MDLFDIAVAKKLAGGGGGGILVLHEGANTALDKTFGEINESFENGKPIVIFVPAGNAGDYPPYPTMSVVVGIRAVTGGISHVEALRWTGTETDVRVYYAAGADKYPSWDE